MKTKPYVILALATLVFSCNGGNGYQSDDSSSSESYKMESTSEDEETATEEVHEENPNETPTTENNIKIGLKKTAGNEDEKPLLYLMFHDYQVPAPNQRLLVKTAQLLAESKDLQKSFFGLQNLTKDYNGYLLQSRFSTERYETNRKRFHDDSVSVQYSNAQYAYLTIRVPSIRLDSFLQDASKNLTVIKSLEVNVQDVTLEQMKNNEEREIYKNTARRMANKIDEPNKKAKLSESIDAEEQLSQTKITEVYSRDQMRQIYDKVAFAVVTMELSKPSYDTLESEYAPKLETKNPFLYQLTSNFGKGWNGFLLFLSGLVLIWPLLLGGSILIAVFFWWKKNGKK